jgi:hypothetical protein
MTVHAPLKSYYLIITLEEIVLSLKICVNKLLFIYPWIRCLKLPSGKLCPMKNYGWVIIVWKVLLKLEVGCEKCFIRIIRNFWARTIHAWHCSYMATIVNISMLRLENTVNNDPQVITNEARDLFQKLMWKNYGENLLCALFVVLAVG